jgi:hypothetical protein
MTSVEFLTYWKEKNFGKMATRVTNRKNQIIGKLAGELRHNVELVQLRKFEILSIRQTTIARADAVVHMQGKNILDETVRGEIEVVSFREMNGRTVMPDQPGKWQVLDSCLFQLMRSKEAERE